MADVNTTACPHCGQRIPFPPPAGGCPGCSLPLPSPQEELPARIERLSRQHQAAGDRLGLLQHEYGDLQKQLDRVEASLEANRRKVSRMEDRDGERLQWETALEEERRLREQAEAAAVELRIVRAEDMERYLQEHQQPQAPTDEEERWRQLAEAALPLEAHIGELEQENTALQAKLREAERTLLDAADMVGQLAELRKELERLGARYLHAREEASRLLNEKLDLRTEIDKLAEQLLQKASRERCFPPPTIEQARERIRAAIRREDSSPPRLET